MILKSYVVTALVLAVTGVVARAGDGNRLAYVDENNPYYVSRTFPKLVTPQWVGEEGVEAVVVLAIDDMRGPEKWEAYLRPILERLKQIDGRAAVSIMTCQVDPQHPHLQTWLKEGVSLETHTIDHPCPLLQGGDFDKAKATYDRCVDLLASVPGNRPVAFRTPCCDSLNTVSPRFFNEIFNKTTPAKNFVAIDSSVFNIITAGDPDLPRELVMTPDGTERFRKYIPTDRTFVNTIEDYPYPYVINRLCWEFPCVVPSDWSAQHRHKPNNPITVEDWKAALDATVIKQGVFNLVFHPHGWIKAEQVVELIDHAVAKHGRKVKFLTFREALERLNQNLLKGNPLRNDAGQDNGVRVLDIDNDGFMDVVVGNAAKLTRVWQPRQRTWKEMPFPATVVELQGRDRSLPPRTVGRFGVLGKNRVSIVRLPNRSRTETPPREQVAPDQSSLSALSTWTFDGSDWTPQPAKGLPELEHPDTVGNFLRWGWGHDVLLRDLNADGQSDLIFTYRDHTRAGSHHSAFFEFSDDERMWRQLKYDCPVRSPAMPHVRFVDVDEDGYDDLVFSDRSRYGLFLFEPKRGWTREVLAANRRKDQPDSLPEIDRGGYTDNGFFIHSRRLFWQNEDTAKLKDLVDRRSFNELLKDVEPGPKSPEASIECIKPRPGFTVELVAAEPLVQDPVAFAWGPDGKLWVAEMGDYPRGVDDKGKFGGRVRLLEDTDGDGRYDKSTVFLEGLGFPTGVTPWRSGVLVTCAPEIFYAEDRDGDGRADVRQSLYTGFAEGNQQHRVNGLVWGLDNWLYGANGDSGGAINVVGSLREPAGRAANERAALDIRGRDFRIRPDEGLIDTQTGQTQFGRNRDDWGNWFGGNNSNPMWHYVLEDHYLRRNPHLAAPDPRVPVSIAPGAAPVFPISRTAARFNDPHAANRFTSACSPIVYRDDLFGPHFENNVFVSEPVHNLVHREIMRPDGVTFKSQRAADEQASEFLTSSDNWFRPTMVRTGPDGSLWIADMYRYVIEHPEWIPDDWEKRIDLRAGHDRGRIYRVFPVGSRPRPIPRLDRLDTAGLVAALDSPSGWQRDMAQQMLLWRADRSAAPLLTKLAGASDRPLARLHALCTLDGLDALDPPAIMRALADPHPGIRRHAVRLSEPHLAKAPDMGAAIANLVGDPDAQVRLQLAYTLGEWHDDRAGEALARLASANSRDPFISAAVASSVNDRALGPMLESALASLSREPADGGLALAENLIGMAVGRNDAKALSSLVRAVARDADGRVADWQLDALASLLDALDRQNTTLAKFAKNADAELQAAIERLRPIFDAARRIAADPRESEADRITVLPLLARGLDEKDQDRQTLAKLLGPQSSTELQVAAVQALGRLRDGDVPKLLTAGWRAYSPTLRTQVIDLMLRRENWTKALLAAVEQKQIHSAEIDTPQRQRLLQHRNANLRDDAKKLFAESADADRQAVIDGYRAVATLAGDPKRGEAAFVKTCAACHRLGSVGNAVGPDLATVAVRPADYLLTALFDPNRAVEARYVNYIAATRNGLVLSGALAGETGTSVTIVGSDGKPQVIARVDLEELASTGKSVMPEGLEKDLKPQDVADMFAFLRLHKPPLPRREFDGNRPELVRAADDGSLLLTARNAEIYGSTLVFEPQYANLGWWTSADDHAVWTVDVPRAGAYAVWFEWACDPSVAGNRFVLEAGESSLRGMVAGTGNWDTYRREKLGDLSLAAGQQRIVLRSDGKPNGAIIDLKSIRLVPR
jgi:putative membrane-bound dehydrogenase-like protein